MAKGKGDFCDEREEHPAFGMVSLHKVRCGGRGVSLFGSAVLHHHYISLEIHQAERTRTLNTDYIHANAILAKIKLSPVQLSELLTSLNTSGVPCTLEYYRGKDGKLVKAGEPPETAKAQKTYEEFIAHTREAAGKIRQMQARLKALAEAGKPVGKRVLEALAVDMCVAAQEVDANMPFILKRFAETCEETVRDAKGEIEAFIGAKIEATGLKTLAEAAPELPQLEDISNPQKGASHGPDRPDNLGSEAAGVSGQEAL